MANDKRDEVIEAAEAFLVEDIGEPTNETEREYFNEIVDTLADFALSREAELRREIAEQLEYILQGANWENVLQKYIEKLRGKQ